MSFFDDFDNKPFEEIINEFFEHSSGVKDKRTIIRGEEEDRNIDFIETRSKIYVVFELPGYREKDITLNVIKNDIEIKIQKKDSESIQTYLTKKLRRGIFFRRTLPEFVNSKKFKYSMKNGILEVIFEKKNK